MWWAFAFGWGRGYFAFVNRDDDGSKSGRGEMVWKGWVADRHKTACSRMETKMMSGNKG